MNEPKRLLAVNLNYLGDVLFTTPALALLRARFPDACIDVQVGERAVPLLAGNGDVDRLLPRPPRGKMARRAALWKALRAERYDAVVLFQSTLASAALAFAARVPVRVGFTSEGCRPLLTHPIAPRRRGEHVVDSYLRLADAFGTAGVERPCRLKMSLSAEDVAFAQSFRSAHGIGDAPVAGLVIGATRPQKRWPEEHWARLADKLWGAAGVHSLLLGGPEEAESAVRIAGMARTPLISAVGATTPTQMAALVARCGVVVSGDSGPLHVATAVGTPVVALFGSTDPAETGPWGCDRGSLGIVLYDALACAPCRKSPSCEGRFDCLRALVPERVFDAVAALLGGPRRRALPVLRSGEAA